MKEASHGILGLGWVRVHAQVAQIAASVVVRRTRNDAETAFSFWFSEEKHEAYP